MENIRIAIIRPMAILPTRKHNFDAGLDLYSAESLAVPPHGQAIVPTGITIDIPNGYVGLVKPKGRSNHLIGAGVVDAGYQGEILVKVVNYLDSSMEIQVGDAIGQLLILPIETPQVVEVNPQDVHSTASNRGGSGGIVDQFSR